MKRLVIAAILGVLALAISVAGVVWLVSGRGSSGLERWIGSQLQLIANSYLNPRLEFSDLDYEYPSTVSVKNLRLASVDPANPGKTIDILGTSDATITLAEIPQVGKPIIIEKIILNRPLFHAVAVAADSEDFVGFSRLMRAESSEPIPKLSDVFQIRLIQLNEGRIVYDPRIPGTVAMELDQINTALHIEPDAQGWYKLQTAIDRPPVFNLSVACRLNIDSFTAEGLDLALKSTLGREHDQLLPPQLQRILREYEVRGTLDVKVTGRVPVADYLASNLNADVEVAEANISIDKYKIPVESLSIQASLADRKLLENITLRALRGQASINGTMMCNDLFETQLAMKFQQMQIGELFRSPGTAEEPSLLGTLTADIQIDAPMRIVLAKLQPPETQPTEDLNDAVYAARTLPTWWGEGEIHVDRARLVRIKVVNMIGDSLSQIYSIARGTNYKTGEPTERAAISFALTGDAVQVKDFTYIGDLAAGRGTGTITLNQQLDLTINAGPLERMERFLGGRVGDVIGTFSSSIASYHVTGRVGDPHVTVQTGQVGNVAKDTAKGVGGAAERVGRGIGGLAERLGGKKKEKDQK